MLKQLICLLRRDHLDIFWPEIIPKSEPPVVVTRRECRRCGRVLYGIRLEGNRVMWVRRV